MGVKSKQRHPWTVRKKLPCVAAFTWIWIYYRLSLLDMSTSVQSDRFWPGNLLNAVATRESRECAVDWATIYLWLCVSPQDENFQGKPVRPLFLTNSPLNDFIGLLKKEKEGNTKKKIEEYPFWQINSFSISFAGFYGDENDGKYSDDFGWKVYSSDYTAKTDL